MRPHCWWNNISLVINLLQMRCRQFIVSIASEIERMSSCKRITLIKIWGLEALHDGKFKYEIECPMAVEHVTMSIVEPSSGILLIYFAVILFQRSPVLMQAVRTNLGDPEWVAGWDWKSRWSTSLPMVEWSGSGWDLRNLEEIKECLGLLYNLSPLRSPRLQAVIGQSAAVCKNK